MKLNAAVALASTIILTACGGSGSGDPVVDFADAGVANFGPVQAASNQANDSDFATILNSLRSDRGLGSMNYDARLDVAAENYAIEQSQISGLSHTGVDGSSVYDRIVATGYNPKGWAENLAKGYQSQAQVLQAWINSPGHNRNLNADLEDFAIGVAGSGSNLSWVLVMATER